MNRHTRSWNIVIAILGVYMVLEPLSTLAADKVNLRITCERKRFDVGREDKGNKEVKEEEWGYSVTIDNTSFKDLQGLRVDYLLFGEQDIPGSRASREICTKGSVDMAEFAKNQKYTFDTEKLVMTSSQLDANWRYTSGAPTRSRGRMSGIWIKVFQNGQEVTEYANPPTLKSKNWDKPLPVPQAQK